MADYVPFSAPQIQARPWDFVSGMDASAMEERQREAQKFALERMMLDNQMRGLEVDRYGQMTPHEVAVRGFDAAYADAKKPFVGELAQGDVGNAKFNQARGQLAQGTVGSETALKNIQNHLQGLEGTARQLELFSSMSPMWTQAQWQQVYDQMDPQVKRFFPKMWTPDIPGRINQLSQMIQNSPEHRRAKEIKSIEETGANSRNRLTNETAELGHWLNLLASRYRAHAASSGNDKLNLEQFITQHIRNEIAAQRMTPQMGAQIIERILQNKDAAPSNVIDPNILLPQIVPGAGPRSTPPLAIPGPLSQPGASAPMPPRPQDGPLSDFDAQQRLGPNYDPNYIYRLGPNGLERKKR